MHRLILLPLLLIVTPAIALDCRCACMAGQAVTLCARAEAAREGGNLCPAEFRCPALHPAPASEGSDAAGVALSPPVPDAVNCRSEAVWNAVTSRYEPRKICNLRPPEAP